MTLLRQARPVPCGAGATSPTTVVDLRVLDGVIHAIEPMLDAQAGEEVVDLDGRWLAPGLWDAHAHLGTWAQVRRRLDVSSATNARDLERLLTEHLRSSVPTGGGTIVGYGYRDVLWPEPISAAALDRACAAAGRSDVGIALVCGDLHSACFSTVAAHRLGLSPGVLRETAWFAAAGVLDPDEATLDAWVAEAASAAAARGVVGVVDYELADNLTAWRRRFASGFDALRISAGVWPEHLDHVIAKELGTGDAVLGTGGLLTQGPLKVIADGSLNTSTAFCDRPYPPGVSGASCGAMNITLEVLAPLMAKAARGGITSAIHAIGDAANAVVLDAFAATRARGSIEHAQLLRIDDVGRIAALGIAASVQPEHLVDDRDAVDGAWADRADRAYMLRTLHDAGVRLMCGSDAPVAPLEPWFAIASAVTRTKDGRDAWHPEQALPARVALASSVRSSVAVGQPADLVVLDADPLDPTVAVDGTLRTMPVAATMLAGRFTHRAL